MRAVYIFWAIAEVVSISVFTYSMTEDIPADVPLPLECDCSPRALSENHRVISNGIARSCYEALCAGFGLHHSSPTQVTVAWDGSLSHLRVSWVAPDERLYESWADRDEVVERGAICLALPAVRALCGLEAVRRLQKFTGADYFLGPAGQVPVDLKACIRLEVSGVDRGGPRELRSRLRRKVLQLRRYLVHYPGLALVVGFRARTILIKGVAAK